MEIKDDKEQVDVVNITDELYKSDTAKRCMMCYQSLSDKSSLTDNLTNFIAITEKYSYSGVMSRAVNNEQGKMRVTYSDQEMALITDDNSDIVDDRKSAELRKIFINMLNSYIAYNADKESSSTTERNQHKKCIKALLIMLFKNSIYDVIPELLLPEEYKIMVGKAFEKMGNTQDDIYENWLTHLTSTGNEILIPIVESIGTDFFKVPKAINTFYKYFQNQLGEIKDKEALYEKFLEMRAEYAKAGNGVTQNFLYDKDIFDITGDSYTKYKMVIIEDFKRLFTNDNEANTMLIKQLIFGNGGDEVGKE